MRVGRGGEWEGGCISEREKERENEIIKSQRVAAVQTNKQITEMRLFFGLCRRKFAKLTKINRLD